MKKAILVLVAFSLTFIALASPRPAAAVLYYRCAWEYESGGTGPLCNCVIHCGNNSYWSDYVPSSACDAAFSLCCNNWGNKTCN
jgi:hypothetical protein